MSDIKNLRGNQMPYNEYVEKVVENLNEHLINCAISYSSGMECLTMYFRRFDCNVWIDTKILKRCYDYEVTPIICAKEILAYVKQEWIKQIMALDI